MAALASDLYFGVLGIAGLACWLGCLGWPQQTDNVLVTIEWIVELRCLAALMSSYQAQVTY